jgi:hypothetical protein
VVVPCLTKSNFSATARDTSTIRFREVGPQSLTVASTLLPFFVFVILTLVPHGRLLCAVVSSDATSWSNNSSRPRLYARTSLQASSAGGRPFFGWARLHASFYISEICHTRHAVPTCGWRIVISPVTLTWRDCLYLPTALALHGPYLTAYSWKTVSGHRMRKKRCCHVRHRSVPHNLT